MKKNEKGFTLVELLAVIVILGLLMAIAIPSVTKYITQSRVKTLVSTMDSYVTAVVTQVNDGEYKFSDSTKVFAIPIECVALEKGGTDPFGNWYQANDNYWAYVLVQYDSENYNYVYGFTFKDDARYGMYPTINANITNSLVRTGYNLTKPKSGLAISFVEASKWEGFNITSTTELVVLEAVSEGVTGDGKTTCTLCQKGDNYEEIEEEKKTRPFVLLSDIKKKNSIINTQPTLFSTFTKSSDASGLYASNATNSGDTTYYFRGNVTNNFVSFAGYTWRIVRINEDNSIRIISQEGINNNTKYSFNSQTNNWIYTYYSNSEVKNILESWYSTNLQQYDLYITQNIFCEQAKVAYRGYTAGSTTMKVYTSYTPDFKCASDGNGKGIISSKVGLITYDEVLYAGGYVYKSNSSYYLYNGSFGIWTMSPAGFDSSAYAYAWYVYTTGLVNAEHVNPTRSLRPVINLNAGVLASGTGTSADPYVVQTS